jgi:hypothetical protein
MRWEAVPNPEPPADLVTVLAISSTDAWFAGNYNGDAGMVVEHWDGRVISVVSTPNDFNVEQLAGTRPDSIWLLGWVDEYAYLEHWNGSTWSDAKPPRLGLNAAWQSISARGMKDVWAVGYEDTDANTGIVGHWDGSRWHYTTNGIFARGGAPLLSVLDLGPRNVWAMGTIQADHFNGSRWRVTPGPAPGPDGYFEPNGIAGLRHGPIYTVGTSRRSKALVQRWTGSRWVRVSTPLPKGKFNLEALAVGSDGGAWAGGYTWRNLKVPSQPLIERYVPCSGAYTGPSRETFRPYNPKS